MKVKIKRIDQNLPLPVYETSGSVGFDLLCREDVTINPSEIALLPPAVPIGIGAGLDNRVFCRSEQLAPFAPISFGRP